MTIQHMLLSLGGVVEEYTGPSVPPPTPGIALSWGNGFRGQLGDNTTVSKSSPVSVVGGYTDWTQVSAGSNHTLGVRENGTAWAWGSSSDGHLGDNTTVSKSSPVSVVGGFTDWTQVSAGQSHSLGVRSNGTAWAWGNGSNGILGNNYASGFPNRSSPVSVVGGFTDWAQLSAGSSHSVGVRSNGTAWSWGVGSQGRLGDNTIVNKSSPVSVVGGFTDWTQVSAGGDHSLGLRENGTAWAWGANFNGDLGNNSTIARSSPVSIVGGFTDWIQLDAGGNHSLGLRENGTAWAWGSNVAGILGDNSTIAKSSPVLVAGGFTDCLRVSAGGAQSLGVR